MVEENGQETEVNEVTKEITDEIITESIIIPDEEEVIEIGSCKIFIDKDKNVRMECKEPSNIKLSKQEIDMLHGLTDLVPGIEENKN